MYLRQVSETRTMIFVFKKKLIQDKEETALRSEVRPLRGKLDDVQRFLEYLNKIDIIQAIKMICVVLIQNVSKR